MMFEAVVAAVMVAPHDPPHKAWVVNVAELYTIAHSTVTIAADLVPARKQRIPTLRSDGKALSFKFVEEVCIVKDGSFMQWTQYA